MFTSTFVIRRRYPSGLARTLVYNPADDDGADIWPLPGDRDGKNASRRFGRGRIPAHVDSFGNRHKPRLEDLVIHSRVHQGLGERSDLDYFVTWMLRRLVGPDPDQNVSAVGTAAP